MEMFSLSEMEMLYERAKGYFTTGQMVPIEFIYRNKSEEYFAEIEAARSQRNRSDQIMESDTKKPSGHPQCPIVVGQLKGLYFGTFVHGNGTLPTISFFGKRRISVNADYFLRPERYSLFFADFYCARYAADVHYVNLVLAVHGSEQERFCQTHLIKLDMQKNPFLYSVQFDAGKQKQCFVVKNGTDQIYLFHAADFNISKCRAAGKCTSSRVELIGNRINNSKPTVGHTYDDRCTVCGIRGKNDTNINSNNLVAQLDSLSLGTSSSGSQSNAKGAAALFWRLWNFDCPDLNCTKEQWATSLTPTDHVFPDVDFSSNLAVNVLTVLKWPNEMAREIGINRKVGIALFRDGIVPDCDHSSCHSGGYFCMFLKTTTGNSVQLAKYDQMFESFLSLAFYQLPAALKSEVSGIFVRAKADIPQHDRQLAEHTGDFPCRFNFELWIQDRKRKENFKLSLTKWVAEQEEQHGMTLETFKFIK